MKKIILVIIVLITTSCNKEKNNIEEYQGSFIYSVDSGYSYTNISHKDDKNYSFDEDRIKDFNKKNNLQNFGKELAVETHGNVKCIKGKDKWMACFNYNYYYDESYMQPVISYNNNKITVEFVENQSSSPFLFFDSSKFKLDKEVTFKIDSEFESRILQSNDKEFFKSHKIEYKQVAYNLFDLLINKENEFQ